MNFVLKMKLKSSEEILQFEFLLNYSPTNYKYKKQQQKYRHHALLKNNYMYLLMAGNIELLHKKIK